MVKLALLMWIVAMFISFLAKAEERKWMARLFVGGFCLMLLAAFIKLVKL